MNTSENDCQDLAATGLKPSLELRHLFATPCPEVLTMIALFKTWLSKSWILLGQRISTLDPCQELCLSWLGLPRREHKWTWLSRLGSHHSSEILHFFLRLGNIPCLEMLHFLATPCPQVLTMIALDIQDLAFQVLKLFGAKNFNIWPLPRIMSFMTWSSKTWPQVNMIVKTWQPQVWNLTFFFATILQLHVLKSWQRLHYSRLGFPSLETFCCIDFQQYNKDLCISWLGLPRHEHKWKYLTRLGCHRSEILHSSFKTWHAKFWNVTCL